MSQANESVSNNKILFENSELTIEEIKALFFKEDALIETTNPVYKLKKSGRNYYYTFDWDNHEVDYYLSASKFIDSVVPKSEHIVNWMLDLGKQEYERQLRVKSEYGTLMHICFGELIISEQFDLSTVYDKAEQHIRENGLIIDPREWGDKLKMDILSMAAFIRDYEVEPLAVEIMLASRDIGIVGVIDLVCKMNDKKYTESTSKAKRKRITALIDFKSGKSFYESHEVQLELYKLIFNENFPEIEIEGIFNWSPKDWRREPSYNFVNQTDKPSSQKVPLYLELANIDGVDYDKSVKSIGGVLSLKEKDLTKHYEVVNLKNLVLNKMLNL